MAGQQTRWGEQTKKRQKNEKHDLSLNTRSRDLDLGRNWCPKYNL